MKVQNTLVKRSLSKTSKDAVIESLKRKLKSLEEESVDGLPFPEWKLDTYIL